MLEYQKVRRYLVQRVPELGYTRKPLQVLKSLLTLLGGTLAWSLIGLVSLYFVAYSGEFDFNDAAFYAVLLLSPLFGLWVGYSNRHQKGTASESYEAIGNSIYFALDDLRGLFYRDRSATLEIAVEILAKGRASRKPLRLEGILENYAQKGTSRAEVAEALRILKDNELLLQEKDRLKLQWRGRHLI